MAQLMRQIGVVVGLTVILTFPVTIVSGAGSQKSPDQVVRFLSGVKGRGAVIVGVHGESIRPASPPIGSPRHRER